MFWSCETQRNREGGAKLLLTCEGAWWSLLNNCCHPLALLSNGKLRCLFPEWFMSRKQHVLRTRLWLT